MLDALAMRYHCRPSAYLDELTPFQALSVDFYAAEVGVDNQRREQTRESHRQRRRGR